MILSDIHGNSIALRECMKYTEKNRIDAIIWCGDYVTDFPGSHEVIDIVKTYAKKYRSYIIIGNRDQNILKFLKEKKCNIKEKGNIEYTINQLTEEDIKWLESLQETIEIKLQNGKKGRRL